MQFFEQAAFDEVEQVRPRRCVGDLVARLVGLHRVLRVRLPQHVGKQRELTVVEIPLAVDEMQSLVHSRRQHVVKRRAVGVGQWQWPRPRAPRDLHP